MGVELAGGESKLDTRNILIKLRLLGCVKASMCWPCATEYLKGER